MPGTPTAPAATSANPNSAPLHPEAADPTGRSPGPIPDPRPHGDSPGARTSCRAQQLSPPGCRPGPASSAPSAPLRSLPRLRPPVAIGTPDPSRASRKGRNAGPQHKGKTPHAPATSSCRPRSRRRLSEPTPGLGQRWYSTVAHQQRPRPFSQTQDGGAEQRANDQASKHVPRIMYAVVNPGEADQRRYGYGDPEASAKVGARYGRHQSP